jgi:hypothetical protein
MVLLWVKIRSVFKCRSCLIETLPTFCGDREYYSAPYVLYSKMRRTSPDGESVSPTKSRRPSPSKIPISAEYLPLSRGGSGSTEFLGRGSTEQLVRGPSLEHLLRGGSTEHLVRAATEHVLRRGSTEHLIRGSTDRLVRGRGSVEQLARGSTERPVSTHSGSSLSASSQQQSPENFKNPARSLNLQ